MAAEERTLIDGHEPTILMPAPGRQATTAMKRPARVRPPAASAAVELQRLAAGVNPLLGAAGVLLAMVPKLRVTTVHEHPAALRVQLLQCIAEFESAAAAGGVPRPKITAARYVLCSFIDEVIAQTPWGAHGGWAQRNLLQEYHEERWGGEKAFQLLERLGQDVATNADLLELFFVCLQLGFEGRYRGAPDGRMQLDAIASGVLDALRPARDAAAPRTLAQHWQGVAMPASRDASAIPWWVLIALAAVVVLGIVLTLNWRLQALARPVLTQIHAAPVALRLDQPTAAAKPRLAPLLQADIASGAIQVRDESMRSLITLPADRLFVAGSARVDPGQLDLLGRIAQALKGLRGQVAVIGHTDNAPVGSLQFPSNWHLSRERAQAVQAVLVQRGASAERLRAEGRADMEPIVPNDSAAGRARNRRIDIELRLLRPDE